MRSQVSCSEMGRLSPLRRTDKDVVLEGEVIYLLRGVVAIEHEGISSHDMKLLFRQSI